MLFTVNTGLLTSICAIMSLVMVRVKICFSPDHMSKRALDIHFAEFIYLYMLRKSPANYGNEIGADQTY
jgi:hypothetical protein